MSDKAKTGGTNKSKTIQEQSPKKGVSNRKTKKERVCKQYMFSLTEEISADIDNLTMAAPRTSRSDIVKAGVEMLKSLNEEALKKFLMELK